VNTLVLLVAGRRWMPIVGILHHRGRRSGRMYASRGWSHSRDLWPRSQPCDRGVWPWSAKRSRPGRP